MGEADADAGAAAAINAIAATGARRARNALTHRFSAGGCVDDVTP